MVLHNGNIFDKKVKFDNDLINQQVVAYRQYVGKVAAIDTRNGAVTVIVNEATISVHFTNLSQIYIAAREPIGGVQADNAGNYARPLRFDQWEYALENFVMTGEDQVQFGWYKESERDPDDKMFFQLPIAGSVGNIDKSFVDIIELARKKNLFGDYLYDTVHEIMEAYAERTKGRTKKKKTR